MLLWLSLYLSFDFPLQTSKRPILESIQSNLKTVKGQVWSLQPSPLTTNLNPYNAEILLLSNFRPKVIFNLKPPYMSWIALSASFEYLCYWSTANGTILILSFRGSSIDVRFGRLKSVSALKELTLSHTPSYYYIPSPYTRLLQNTWLLVANNWLIRLNIS